MPENLITGRTTPLADTDAVPPLPSPPPGKNMKFCKTCGSEIAKSAKACPHCGAKNKKPVYKRIWFILLCVIAAIIILAVAAALLEDPSKGKAFDPATNTVFSCGGMDFSIPSYYEKNGAAFTVAERWIDAAYLEFLEMANSIPDFSAYKTEVAKVAGEAGLNQGLTLTGDPVYVSVARRPAWRCDMESDSHHGRVLIINNEAVNKSVIVVFLQNNRAVYDYAADFKLILDSAGANGGVNPDFRAMMDSYEAFFDEYIAFMQKYSSDPGNAMGMLSDYTDFLSRYATVMEAMKSIDTSNLSNDDMAYYLDVTARISQKLLKIAG